ncbi:ap2 domain transcription factor ap2viii-1 [Cystoisospora suis]|uniref:Ap2 domain transcription factor ap2viii-1 n=1 Tax=Cystoisospora suis TaxID=483139 RepID=A0A2C6KKE2_9APIC|nr:ap2 domain transcription factor ap2viii-1 [Cystoisospora suis]
MMMSKERDTTSTGRLSVSPESQSSSTATTATSPMPSPSPFDSSGRERKSEGEGGAARDTSSFASSLSLSEENTKGGEVEKNERHHSGQLNRGGGGHDDQDDDCVPESPRLFLPSPQSGLWMSSTVLDEPREEVEDEDDEEKPHSALAGEGESERYLDDFLPAAAHHQEDANIESSVHPSDIDAVVEREEGEVDRRSREGEGDIDADGVGDEGDVSYPVVITTSSLADGPSTSCRARTPGTVVSELDVLASSSSSSSSISPSPRTSHHHYYPISQAIRYTEEVVRRREESFCSMTRHHDMITTYPDQIRDENEEGERQRDISSLPPTSLPTSESRTSFSLSMTGLPGYQSGTPHHIHHLSHAPTPRTPLNGFSDVSTLSPITSGKDSNSTPTPSSNPFSSHKSGVFPTFSCDEGFLSAGITREEMIQFNQRSHEENTRMVLFTSAYASAVAKTLSLYQRKDEEGHTSTLHSNRGGSDLPRLPTLPQLPSDHRNGASDIPSTTSVTMIFPPTSTSLVSPSTSISNDSHNGTQERNAVGREEGHMNTVDNSAVHNDNNDKDGVAFTKSLASTSSRVGEISLEGERRRSVVGSGGELLSDSPISMDSHSRHCSYTLPTSSASHNSSESVVGVNREKSLDQYGRLLDRLGEKLSSSGHEEEREEKGGTRLSLPLPVSSVLAISEGFREHLQVLVKGIILAAARAGRGVFAARSDSAVAGGGGAGVKTVGKSSGELRGDDRPGRDRGAGGQMMDYERGERETTKEEGIVGRRGSFVLHGSERSTVAGMDEEQGKDNVTDSSGEDSGRERDRHIGGAFSSVQKGKKRLSFDGKAEGGIEEGFHRQVRTMSVGDDSNTELLLRPCWITGESNEKRKEEIDVKGLSETQLRVFCNKGEASPGAMSSLPPAVALCKVQEQGYQTGGERSCSLSDDQGDSTQQQKRSEGDREETMKGENKKGEASSYGEIEIPPTIKEGERRLPQREGSEERKKIAVEKDDDSKERLASSNGRVQKVHALGDTVRGCGGETEPQAVRNAGESEDSREESGRKGVVDLVLRGEEGRAVSSGVDTAERSIDCGGGEGVLLCDHARHEVLKKDVITVFENGEMKGQSHQSEQHIERMAKCLDLSSTGVHTPTAKGESREGDVDDSLLQGANEGGNTSSENKNLSEFSLLRGGGGVYLEEGRGKRYSGMSVSSSFSTACPSSSIADDPSYCCSSVSSSPHLCGVESIEEETAYHTQVLRNCRLDELSDYALLLLPFLSSDPTDVTLSSYDPSYLHSVLLQLHFLKQKHRVDYQQPHTSSLSSSSSSMNHQRHMGGDSSAVYTSLSRKSSDSGGKDRGGCDRSDLTEEGNSSMKIENRKSSSSDTSGLALSGRGREDEERDAGAVSMNSGSRKQERQVVGSVDLNGAKSPLIVLPSCLSSSSSNFLSPEGEQRDHRSSLLHLHQSSMSRKHSVLVDHCQKDVRDGTQGHLAESEGRRGGPGGSSSSTSITGPSSSAAMANSHSVLAGGCLPSLSSTSSCFLSPPSGVYTAWEDDHSHLMNANANSPSTSCSLLSSSRNLIGEERRAEGKRKGSFVSDEDEEGSDSVPPSSHSLKPSSSPFALPPATNAQASCKEENEKSCSDKSRKGMGESKETERPLPTIILTPSSSAVCTPRANESVPPSSSGGHQSGRSGEQQEEKGVECASDTEGSLADEQPQPRKSDDNVLMVVTASPSSPPSSAFSPSSTPPLSPPGLPSSAEYLPSSLLCSPLPPPCTPIEASGEGHLTTSGEKGEKRIEEGGILSQLARHSPSSCLSPGRTDVVYTVGEAESSLTTVRPPPIQGMNGEASFSSSQEKDDVGFSFSQTKEGKGEDTKPLASSIDSDSREEDRQVGTRDFPATALIHVGSTVTEDKGQSGGEGHGPQESTEDSPGQIATTASREVREDLGGIIQRSEETSRTECTTNFGVEQTLEQQREEEEKMKKPMERPAFRDDTSTHLTPQHHPLHHPYTVGDLRDSESATGGGYDKACTVTRRGDCGVFVPSTDQGEDAESVEGFFPAVSSQWSGGYVPPTSSSFSPVVPTATSTTTVAPTPAGWYYPTHYYSGDKNSYVSTTATPTTTTTTPVSRDHHLTGGTPSPFVWTRSSSSTPVDNGVGHSRFPAGVPPHPSIHHHSFSSSHASLHYHSSSHPHSSSSHSMGMTSAVPYVRPASSDAHPPCMRDEGAYPSSTPSSYPPPVAGHVEATLPASHDGRDYLEEEDEGRDEIIPRNGPRLGCSSRASGCTSFQEDELTMIMNQQRREATKKRSKGKSKGKPLVPLPPVPFVTIGLEGKPGGRFNLATPAQGSRRFPPPPRKDPSSGKTEVTATRVARLSKKAMEFPYVHGVRFEIEHFAWTASLGKEFRRFLVKKHGFGKARFCAVGKIELWRSNLSPAELQRELQAEQEVLSVLPSPDASDDEGEGDALRAIEAEVTRYQSPMSPPRKRLRMGDDRETVPRTFASYHHHHPRFLSGSYDPHNRGHMGYTYEASLTRKRRSKDSSSDSGCTEEEDSRYCGQSNPPFLSRAGSMGPPPNEVIYPEQGDCGFVPDHPLVNMHQGGMAGASYSWSPHLQSQSISHFYGPPYLPQSTGGNYHPSPFSPDYMHYRYHQQFSVPQHTPSSVSFPREGVDMPSMEKPYRPCPPSHDEVHTAPQDGVYGEKEDRSVEGKSQERTEVLNGANTMVEEATPQEEGIKEDGLPLPGGEQGEEAGTVILLENNNGCSRDAVVETPGVSTTEWPSIEQEEGGGEAYQFSESQQQLGEGEMCTASEGVGVGELRKPDTQSSAPLVEERSALESAGEGAMSQYTHQHLAYSQGSLQPYMHHPHHHPSLRQSSERGRQQQQGRGEQHQQQNVSSGVPSYVTAQPMNERRLFRNASANLHQHGTRYRFSHVGGEVDSHEPALQAYESECRDPVRSYYFSSYGDASHTPSQFPRSHGAGVYTARHTSSASCPPGGPSSMSVPPCSSAPYCPPPSHSYYPPEGVEAKTKGEPETDLECESPGLSPDVSVAQERYDFTNSVHNFTHSQPFVDTTTTLATGGGSVRPDTSGSAVCWPDRASTGPQYCHPYSSSSFSCDGNIYASSRGGTPFSSVHNVAQNVPSTTCHSAYPPCHMVSSYSPPQYEHSRWYASRRPGYYGVSKESERAHHSQIQPYFDPMYAGGTHSWYGGYNNHGHTFVSRSSEVPVTQQSSIPSQFPVGW